MTRAADRTRRRRTVWVVAGAAAAVVVVAAGIQVVVDRLADGPEPAAPSPAARPVPDGKRLVGIGHAAIAVPDEWARNHLGCGTPTKDTFAFDVGLIPTCVRPRPAGVDAVWLHHDDAFGRGEEIEIDGTPATRTPVTCSSGQHEGAVVTCSASVYVPSEDVRFDASSSTSRERVDDLLDEVRILDGEVGLPPFSALTGGVSADAYARSLSDLGLTVERHGQVTPRRLGKVLDLHPEPGTVVPEGSTVIVTVGVSARLQ